MPLTLHYHPLSSSCWKGLIGLYELGLPFDKHLVDLGDPSSRGEFLRLWPLGKFPVLRDEARGRTIPESTILLEYADRLAASKTPLIPTDPDLALEARLRERLFDLYIHTPMQAIVADRLRPAADRDKIGVARSRAQIEAAYDLLNAMLPPRGWAVGDDWTIADCSAFPALYYGDKVAPIGARAPNLSAYFARIAERPSVRRVLAEAEPFLHMFPTGD